MICRTFETYVAKTVLEAAEKYALENGTTLERVVQVVISRMSNLQTGKGLGYPTKEDNILKNIVWLEYH